ncbi:prolyl 4-hydroxylase subunit alpha-3-like isoform X2 [Biomphalaria glabrata]|uniref:Prolyl 4-hydroxylase subunit alpha-3-like isoform X2 n=1 Tax=Biomphalaria glabrata TaxID=6526 RepID=A0A9W3BHF0_BIOGL|nr:prolyl 4-hydroxylase subunit alpha-3-like isoform X2 [Biomphalaria glabrata]
MDKGLRFITSLALAVTCVRLMTSDVVTSSMKIRRMVTEEKNLLLKLKSFIDNQIESIKNMSQFYADRRLELLVEKATTNMTDLEHPNTIYHVIKKFVHQYGKALNENYDCFLKTIQKSTDVYLSEQPEINEASMALLRLQAVYNLTVTDMVDGDYLGYKGPALTSVDAVELGVFALSAQDYLTSLDWLNASITKHSDMTYTQTLLIELPTIAVLKALMGLVYLRIGKIDEAKHLYNESKMLDPKSFSLAELEQQLLNPPDVEPVIERELTLSNYSRLCRQRHQQFHQPPNDVRLVCRYRGTLLPYYRFQEELLSISPFVSLIYKFTTDAESEFFKSAVRNKLKKVEEPDSADDSSITETRTGQVAYVEENSSETARQLVDKIAHVTYLETSFQNGKKAVDSLQVVNYGLAGHFKVNNDSATHLTSYDIVS